jgi:hypothetical protein
MACNMDTNAEAVWRAITSTQGVTSWFTANANIGIGVDAHTC